MDSGKWLGRYRYPDRTNANPFCMTVRCKVCDEPTHDDEGHPIGTVWVYQKVEGKIQLARNLVLHAPLFHVHETCIAALNDRL